MKDLKNQQTTKPEKVQVSEALDMVSGQITSFTDSPALAALEAKLLRRRRHAAPRTYRRPAYLEYIEYA